jgi:hypothetical protein
MINGKIVGIEHIITVLLVYLFLLIVSLTAGHSSEPNVSSLSVFNLRTGSLLDALRFYHITRILPPCTAISAFCDSAPVGLLRLILSANVALPSSLDGLNSTLSLPVLFLHPPMEMNQY